MRRVPAPHDHASPARALVRGLNQRVGAKRRLPRVCDELRTRIGGARGPNDSAKRRPRRTPVSQHGPPAVRPRRLWAVMPGAMGLAPAPRSPEAANPRGWWGAVPNTITVLQTKVLAGAVIQL